MNKTKYKDLINTKEKANIQLAYQLFVVSGSISKEHYLWDVWNLDSRFLNDFDKYQKKTYVHRFLSIQIRYNLSTVRLLGKSEVFKTDLRVKKLHSNIDHPIKEDIIQMVKYLVTNKYINELIHELLRN